jgi:hypothetical protein
MDSWSFFREHMASDLFRYGLCHVHIDYDDWYENNQMFCQLHDILIDMDMESDPVPYQKYVTWYIKSKNDLFPIY